MKKWMLLVALLISLSAQAFEFRDSVLQYTLQVPENFTLVRRGSGNEICRAVFSCNDAEDRVFSIYYFKMVTDANKTLNKAKALALPDSLFFNNLDRVDSLCSAQKIGNWAKATTYKHHDKELYAKYYKQTHNEGMLFLTAWNTENDFATFDQIAESTSFASFYTNLLMIAIFGLILPGVIFFYACSQWRGNKQKFLVALLVGIIYCVVAHIWISWLVLLAGVCIGCFIYWGKDSDTIVIPC